nr:MAG TPA: hypothetical protein [Caudoviricetes sp.]
MAQVVNGFYYLKSCRQHFLVPGFSLSFLIFCKNFVTL